jgi:phage gpG-like protein
VFKANITIAGATRMAKAYRTRSSTLPTLVGNWLGDSAREIVRKGIKSNFDTESADGIKWAALAPRTIEERGGSAHPILFRTGALLNEALGLNGNNSKISRTPYGMNMKYEFKSDKAKELHFGVKEANLPARPFLLLTKNADKELRLSFHKLIFNK